MQASEQNTSLGLPVEPGNIERELKKLWSTDESTSTRASLINFAICCEGKDALEKNTSLIAEFMKTHACRALLLCSIPETSKPKVQSWISAHCNITRAGAKQVCCEQISFLIEGNSAAQIPAVLFSHLDSDLPLHLWWQGDFPEKTNEQLWQWVDRLVFDSRDWKNPAAQLPLLLDSISPINPRMIFCDLNWARTLDWRQTIAGIFDSPDTLPHLANLKSIRITHRDSESRMAAILLTAWLAARLGWKLEGSSKNRISFETVSVDLIEEAGDILGRVELVAEEASFTLQHSEGGTCLQTHSVIPDHPETTHLTPLGADDTTSLLNRELTTGGKHDIYRQTLCFASQILTHS